MNYSYLTETNFNAGIYIRLSQEDRDKKYETDSESVINQKDILRTYARNNGFNLVDEYVDDGYSGTNFDRPGFKRMLEDIKKKKINLVIVKDLSRFGRDHVMTGYYIETFFPENRVRFVSIVENYDSMKNQASNDSSTFIIACNDYYSKQNSLKIRNVLDAKRKDGKFIGSSPCYGYKRDPLDKGHLIVDKSTAKYVKMIFEWRSKDIGISEIATRLTNMNVPTPSALKKINYSSRLKDNKQWTIHSVKKILQNRMYTGDMVQHTQTNISYKSKKKITLDDSLWVIVENTHEPIISKDLFRMINYKIKHHNRIYNVRVERERRLLEGLLYCKECGNRLGVSYRKNHDYWTINCNKYARDPIRGRCAPHFFPYDKFEKQVLDSIYELFKDIFKSLNVKELNDVIINRLSPNSNSIVKTKNDLEHEKNKIEEMIQTIYQDRISGAITLESYQMLAKPYEEKIKDINSKIEDIEFELLKRKDSLSIVPNYIKKIKKLLNLKEPSRELLFSIIDRIEVDNDRNIKLIFKYDILDSYEFKYDNKND